MKDVLKDFSPEDFLNILPSPSKEYAISALNADTDLVQVAARMAVEPGVGLVTKGGELWPSDIMPRIVKEVHTLLCTEDPKYDSVRDKFKGEGATTANVIVYVVSNAVAAHAGMATALCVPLVALLLAAIVKVSLSAWCQAHVQQAEQVARTQQIQLVEGQQTEQTDENTSEGS